MRVRAGPGMLTMQQEQGLAVARLLVKAGMPLFVAPADHTAPHGFRLPMGWQQTECDPAVVDSWRPGDALCAVTGRAFDLVDIDPRSGGTEESIPMPHSYLAAETPSGGRHHFVSPLGVASRDGVAPGVDVKSGTLEGTGRGFAFVAPTVRASKVDGVAREYRWYTGPDGPGLPSADQRAGDGSGAMLRARVMELRRTQPQHAEPRRVPLSVARREFDRSVRGLADDVRRWRAMGWGGDAHSGLLAATTHLARLDHSQAEAAFLWAFATAGVVPDEADLTKLHSAIERAVPDIVVPDEQLTAQERFFLGGDSPLGVAPGLGGTPATWTPGPPTPSGDDLFAPVTRERFRDRTPDRPATYGAFGGSIPLVYDEGVHWLQGESESGKSWVALAVAVDVLRRGGSVLVVDYEDIERRVFERLDQLGLTDDEVGRLVYVDGHEAGFHEIVSHVAVTRYDAMLIDGVTSALSQAGLSGRDEQELTRWADLVPRMATMALCVDHVVKDVEGRNGMAIGSQAKKSVVTGSSFEVRAKEKFGRGKSGTIELRLQKDKPGFLRGTGLAVVTLAFSSDAYTGSVSLCVPSAARRPAGGDFSGTERLAEAWALVVGLEQFEGARADHSMRHLKTVVRSELGVRASNDAIEDAIRAFKARAGVQGVTASAELLEYAVSMSVRPADMPNRGTVKGWGDDDTQSYS